MREKKLILHHREGWVKDLGDEASEWRFGQRDRGRAFGYPEEKQGGILREKEKTP